MGTSTASFLVRPFQILKHILDVIGQKTQCSGDIQDDIGRQKWSETENFMNQPDNIFYVTPPPRFGGYVG